MLTINTHSGQCLLPNNNVSTELLHVEHTLHQRPDTNIATAKDPKLLDGGMMLVASTLHGIFSLNKIPHYHVCT